MIDLSDSAMSKPVATVLHLACVENHDVDQVMATQWNGRPFQDGEYLLFLMMVWHLCSLLEPNLDKHASVNTFLTGSTGHWHPSLSFQTSKLPPSFKPLLQLLESSLQAHPLHVYGLTSSPFRLCETIVSTQSSDSESETLSTHRFLQYMRDRGGGSEAEPGETSLPWMLETRGARLGRFDSRQDDTLPAIDRATTWHGAPGVYLNGTATGIFPEEALSTFQFKTLNPLQNLPVPSRRERGADDRYEAHGVWVIIKALAQQNGNAVLFLRTMVCIAALLCYVQSLFVEHFLLDIRH